MNMKDTYKIRRICCSGGIGNESLFFHKYPTAALKTPVPRRKARHVTIKAVFLENYEQGRGCLSLRVARQLESSHAYSMHTEHFWGDIG